MNMKVINNKIDIIIINNYLYIQQYVHYRMSGL